ncbi:MAG: alpha/beta hydrolase [Thermodesulfobacteriota bacterium]
MPNVTANGIQVEYETFGETQGKPLLLIKGIQQQLITWPEDFCSMLAKAGHFVIRFDHRDVGLSTKFENEKTPELAEIVAAFTRGEKIKSPYTLDDMAADTVGLLEALGIEKAHVCGMSMGGAIAQVLTLNYPSRVLSLTLMMTGTGNPDVPGTKPEALAAILAPQPDQREAYIEHHLKTFRILSSPKFTFNEEKHRQLAGKLFDRSYYPVGMNRHFLAVLSQENRKPALKNLKIPALVIHGADDPLVPVEAGRDAAEAIPDSELLIIEGMGHDLPFEVWPTIVEAITNNTNKGQ